MPKFGNWYLLDEDKIDEKVDKNWDGVYKIRVKRKKIGSNPPKDIKKYIEEWPGQVIYIGRSHGKTPSSGIRFRLRNHLNSTGPHTNHCMIKMREAYHLEFSIKVTTREDAGLYEKQEIAKYKEIFGELPLCNSNSP